MNAETIERRLMNKLDRLVTRSTEWRAAFNADIANLTTTQIMERVAHLHRAQQAARLAAWLIESRGDEPFSEWLAKAVNKQYKMLHNNTATRDANPRTLDAELFMAWMSGCADVLSELLDAQGDTHEQA